MIGPTRQSAGGPVLLVTSVYPPRHGGSGRWFHDLYTRLGDTFVAAGPSDDPAADAAHDTASPIPIERVSFPPPGTGLLRPSGIFNFIRCYHDLARIARRGRVAAVHAGCVLPEGLLGAALAVRFRIPLTVYVHGEEVRGAALGRELNALARLTFRRTARIVANTQNTASLLAEDWGLPAGKVRVLHPGVDASRFVPARRNSAGRAALGWGDRPVILTVGRLQARKGQDMLIRALPTIRRTVPNVLYAVVGGGDYEASLRMIAEECGVADAVLFHGAVGEDTMLAAYQQCDLFALPNRDVGFDTEGFGIVLLEAAACQKPAVCGIAGGTGEAVEDEVTGIQADCQDPSAVASVIISLLTHPNRRAAMGAAGRTRVERAFDWPTRIEAARSLFDMGPATTSVESSNL